ncbi:tripartite tricarboxylate transporter TctB family protein [Blastococcus montanus]|uniref:tripartite tricarboxylate transporter TctB family protein n=1 Tax=Blastococcus montanus TaxID=3144973 RepID=UPI00320A5ED1
MSSAPDGAHRPTGPGGQTAAGTGPAGLVERLHEDPTVADADDLAAEMSDEDRPPPAGPLANVVIALVVVAFGIAAMAGSIGLGIGSTSTPAGGTWPFLISVVLIALGLGLLPLARRTADAERFTRASWLVVAGVATMVGFVAVIGVIGFEIPAAVLVFVWLRFLGRESWRLSAGLTLGVVAAFYLVFVVALSVPIPHLF